VDVTFPVSPQFRYIYPTFNQSITFYGASPASSTYYVKLYDSSGNITRNFECRTDSFSQIDCDLVDLSAAKELLRPGNYSLYLLVDTQATPTATTGGTYFRQLRVPEIYAPTTPVTFAATYTSVLEVPGVGLPEVFYLKQFILASTAGGTEVGGYECRTIGTTSPDAQRMQCAVFADTITRDNVAAGGYSWYIRYNWANYPDQVVVPSLATPVFPLWTSPTAGVITRRAQIAAWDVIVTGTDLPTSTSEYSNTVVSVNGTNFACTVTSATATSVSCSVAANAITELGQVTLQLQAFKAIVQVKTQYHITSQQPSIVENSTRDFPARGSWIAFEIDDAVAGDVESVVVRNENGTYTSTCTAVAVGGFDKLVNCTGLTVVLPENDEFEVTAVIAGVKIDTPVYVGRTGDYQGSTASARQSSMWLNLLASMLMLLLLAL
jgi:hypothetical protein